MKRPWRLSSWIRKLFTPLRAPIRTPRPSVRPWLEPLEMRWLPAPMTFTVTDNTDASTHSLRAALVASNANAPGAGMVNTIKFAITGSATIDLLTALPKITQPVDILGFSQGGAGYNGPPLVVLNGASAGSGVNGLDFEAGSSASEVQGLGIQQFSNDGILFNGTSRNLVVGNYIGTDVNGTTSLGNGAGVVIENRATANTLGGTASGAANVISGNFGVGVILTDSGTSGNVVLGNKIGTDVNGTANLGNAVTGVVIENGATANTLGGTASGAANVISGNFRDGVVLTDSGTSRNVVLGNKIGTDVNGTAKLGNGAAGVEFENEATANTLGGTASGAANVISGNGNDGVNLTDSGTSRNVVLGNKIGTDVNGTANLENSFNGVEIENSATANTLGGTASGAANVISGNGNDGVNLTDSGTSRNVVLGNLIGTDVHGIAKLGNGGQGVGIEGATANTIGGTASGAANVISGNGSEGVSLDGPGTSGNVVLGNKIGTDVHGTAKLGNGEYGVNLEDEATANTIGGTASGAANVISGNSLGGVYLTIGVSGNVVLGNKIGTDVHGTANLGNRDGVVINSSSTANTIGGTASGAANVISGNGNYGVYLRDSGTSGNVVLGNKIGTDLNGTAKLGNSLDGVFIASGATANTVGGTATGAANVISGNGGYGVDLRSSGTSGNVVLGNKIGTNISGTANLGNSRDGVFIASGPTANTVGGSTSGAANVISGNGRSGVDLYGGGTSGNVVLGNKIGTDRNGTAKLGNSLDGVVIRPGATANTVGGTASGAANVISGNGHYGVALDGGTSGNVVLGNNIGTDLNGTTPLGNTADGVLIGGTSNTVGGTATGAANVISGNAGDGVALNGSGTSGNVVLGNRIGTDVHGTAKLGNGGDGVVIEAGATANTVGGTASGAANVISGNAHYGVYLRDSGTSGNVVLGNKIGTDVHGTAKLGNADDGVVITGDATANTLGGTASGAVNVISGNGNDGVYLTGSGTSGNVVLGNRIGTDASGTAPLGNGSDGVGIENGATANTLGGSATGAGNVIAANVGEGVFISDSGTSGNLVVGNNIGTDRSGTRILGNGSDGVRIRHGATANTVGGTASGDANVLSGNGGNGVYLLDSGTSGNVVLGNKIGTDVNGTAKLGNTGDGVLIQSAATANTVGGSAANVISANKVGVEIGGSVTGNTVTGNLIGTDVTGTRALGNTVGLQLDGSGDTIDQTTAPALNTIEANTVGVELSASASANQLLRLRLGTNAAGTAALPLPNGTGLLILGSNNTVGGTTAADANVISGNRVTGVEVQGSAATGNVVEFNFIGTDVNGTAALGNGGAGVLLDQQTSGNTVGGNVISANRFGVFISDHNTSGNVVMNNFIGTDVNGTAALGNTAAGVFLQSGAALNTVGGTSPGSSNTIAFNGKGVVVGSSPSDTTTVRDSILGNSIFANAGLGIDLGNNGLTPNGTNPRAFPNDGQNHPILTTVSTTSVSGTLTSQPNHTYRLEFFASVLNGPPLQGQTFLGFQVLTTNGQGKLTFTMPVTITSTQVVTVTATDVTESSPYNGDTSEFSQIATTTRVTSSPTINGGSDQTVTLTALVTSNNLPVTTGTVTFLVVGLGSVTVNVDANGHSPGVAVAQFVVPGGTPAGQYTIIAVYQGQTFASSSSDPFADGILTVLSSGPHIPTF